MPESRDSGAARRPTKSLDILETEVLVSGGGMVGLTLGIALAGAGVATVVVDAADPAALQAVAYDGRCSAIASPLTCC